MCIDPNGFIVGMLLIAVVAFIGGFISGVVASNNAGKDGA